MNFLTALASIIPQIAQAITVAEALFPAAATGETKLAHVIAKAKEIIAGAPLLLDHAGQLMDAVVPLVKGIVKTLNDTGIFQHGGYADAPPPAPVTADALKLSDELMAELNNQGGSLITVPASLIRDTINALRAAQTPPGGAQDASGAHVTDAPGG